MAKFNATIEEMDEKLQCAICYDRLKEPKLLPCGHHFCQSCLMEVSKYNKNCPTCRRAYKLPYGGVAGLATDYGAKSLIELVEAQESSTEPRCSDHPGKMAELGCMTCSLQPICAICTCTVHKRHKIEDIATLAKKAGESMAGKLEEIMRLKGRIEEEQKERENAKRKLDLEKNGCKARLQKTQDHENIRIKNAILEKDLALDQQREDLEERLKRKLVPYKHQLQKEMKRAQEKYDRACNKELQAIEKEFGQLQRQHGVEKDRLGRELVQFNEEIREELELLRIRTEETSRRFKDLTGQYDCIVQKVDKLTMMASDLTASDSHWKQVLGIPGVCSDIDSLIKEVESEDTSSWQVPQLISNLLSKVKQLSTTSSEPSKSVDSAAGTDMRENEADGDEYGGECSEEDE